MDELSSLLKEAKPLYFKRKRQKKIVAGSFLFMIPVILMTSIITLNNAGDEIYISLDNNTLQNELLEDNMGLFR